MNSQIWIEVHTTKRHYYVRQGIQIEWLPGEKVICIDVIKAHPEWSGDVIEADE